MNFTCFNAKIADNFSVMNPNLWKMLVVAGKNDAPCSVHLVIAELKSCPNSAKILQDPLLGVGSYIYIDEGRGNP